MTTFTPGERSRHTELETCQDELDQCREALETRAVIDQAIGVLMADRGCGPDDAFQLLREASQRDNRKVHAIAQAVVDGVRQRAS
jgi:AmiR/NasT family two-component response regulator